MFAVHRHLPLAHRFEQRRLRSRRGAVDLVGEHDLGEQRAGLEDELAGLLAVDRDADQVAGQQVGRELDAGELARQAAGERLGQQRLADAGHVFEQQVPVGQERDERQPDDFGLAEEHLPDVRREGVEQGGQFLRRTRRRGHAAKRPRRWMRTLTLYEP